MSPLSCMAVVVEWRGVGGGFRPFVEGEEAGAFEAQEWQVKYNTFMAAVNVNLRITHKNHHPLPPLRCHEGCTLTKGSIALLESVYTAKAERARRSPFPRYNQTASSLSTSCFPFFIFTPANVLIQKRLYSDEGFDSSKSVYTAKLKELTDLGNPVENRLYETNHRNVSNVPLSFLVWVGGFTRDGT